MPLRRPALAATLALPLLAAALAGQACKSSSPAPSPGAVACDSATTPTTFESVASTDVGVYMDTSDPLLDPVAADLSSYLGTSWGSPVSVARTAPDGSKKRSIWLSTSAAALAQSGVTLTAGYAIQRVTGANGAATIIVYAKDAADLATGAYALLEQLGIRFFHPKQELVPHRAAPVLPTSLAVQRAPLTQQRGLQFHTLHPIEYMWTFQEPSAANLADAEKVVDWLVKTGQNYFQWPLLSTVDFASWQSHAQAIIQYAHSRGVQVGCVVQLWGGASLQNNYVLVSNADQWQEELSSQLGQLMTVPWDVVELALGEFDAASPESIVTWLSAAMTQMASIAPSTQVNVQSHVGDYPQLWVPYDGETVYYYQLPAFADPRLGISVHSLYFFDLYRDWAMYGQPDFHLQHDFLMKELPSRRMNYFPESAYWVTADISTPAFLPEYVVARSNDIQGLAAEIPAKGLPALNGHLMFTSGHEWGYWMTDYLTAKMLWDPTVTVSSLFADYASSYGACASDVASTLSQFTGLQTKYLFDDRLAPYVMAEDTTVDLGFIAGIVTIPHRVQFEDVVAMTEPQRVAFESSVVDELASAAAQVQPLETAMASHCATADADLAPWCDELWDGIAIVRLRLLHIAQLYQATLAYARGEASAQDLLNQAIATTTQAATVIARRETQYRFDAGLLTAAGNNPTIYKYGYLRQAHTQCYFHRREAQVQSLITANIPAQILNLETSDN